jgi:phosphatidylinositol alpha-1,6-mannosyltransferase
MGASSILALVTDAFGGRGGIAQYNRDLTAALTRAPGVARVHLLPRLSPDPPGPLPPNLTQHPARRGRAAYALAAWRLGLRLKPEWVICGHLFMAPLAWAVARRTGARLIIQTHGVEAWARPTPLTRLAAERADLILAVSRDTRAKVLDWARIEPERVRVVSNTVAEDFAPADASLARARLGLGATFVLLTVGRLDSRERYKGHEQLIGFLTRLRDEGLDPLYLVAGEGDDRGRLADLASRLGVADRVRFLGHASREDLPGLYAAADLFVLASSGEGFGIVLLEAMASGAPTLALAAGGAADPLADGELGRLVAESDLWPGLAQACRDRVADRLPRGERLNAEVRRRFGRPAFEQRVHQCLERLEAA